MEIDGSILIEATQSVEGRKWTTLPNDVNFSSTKIHGDLKIEANCGDLLLLNTEIEDDLSIGGRCLTLSARNLHVGGDCTLSTTITNYCSNYPTHTNDYEVDLGRCRVGGMLDICELRFEVNSFSDKGSLLLRGMHVGHTLWVQRHPPEFSSALVVRKLRCDPKKALVQVTVRASTNSDVEAGAWTTDEGTYSYADVLFLVDSANHEKTVLINGDKSLLEKEISCDFTDEEAAKDFLRLYFAAWFNSETGGYAIVEESRFQQHDADKLESLQRLDKGSKCLLFSGYLQHGAVLRKVNFAISDGWRRRVRIEEIDSPIETRSLSLGISRYCPPYRYGDNLSISDYRPLNDGSARELLIDRTKFEELVPNWKQLLHPQDRFADVDINLSGAFCVALQDAGGQAWEKANLSLGNFSYQKIAAADVDEPLLDAGNGEAGLRLKWLRRQQGKDLLNPQPYAQLANVLRSQGDEEGARDIEKAKIRLQNKERMGRLRRKISWLKEQSGESNESKFVAKWHFGFWQSVAVRIRSMVFDPLAYLFWVVWDFMYGECFGYGLGIFRAIVTIVAFWSLGGIAVYSLNYHHQAFVMTKTALAAMEIHDIKVVNPKSNVTATISSALTEDTSQADVPCGRSINAFLYSVETFTPLLNLHQESRCELRHPAPGDRFITWQRTLEVLRFVYIVIGYVMSSLALLTFSGMARRWDQK